MVYPLRGQACAAAGVAIPAMQCRGQGRCASTALQLAMFFGLLLAILAKEAVMKPFEMGKATHQCEAAGRVWTAFGDVSGMQASLESKSIWSYDMQTQQWEELSIGLQNEFALCHGGGLDRNRDLHRARSPSLEHGNGDSANGSLQNSVSDLPTDTLSLEDEHRLRQVQEEDRREQIVPVVASIVRFSSFSIWFVGCSGGIFERFWNGVAWVYIPHHLPYYTRGARSILALHYMVFATGNNGQIFRLRMADIGLVWTPAGTSDPPNGSDSSGKQKNGKQKKKKSIIAKGPGAALRWQNSAYFISEEGDLWEMKVGSNTPDAEQFVNHRSPKSCSVDAVVDPGTFGGVLVLCSDQSLYEYVQKDDAKKTNPKSSGVSLVIGGTKADGGKTSRGTWLRHDGLEIDKANMWGGALVAEAGTAFKMPPGSTLRHSSEDGMRIGGIFMRLRDGGIVERARYEKRWNWVEHTGVVPGDGLAAPLTVAMMDVDKGVPSSQSEVVLVGTTRRGAAVEYQWTTDKTGQGVWKWIEHGHPSFNRTIARAQPVPLDGRKVGLLQRDCKYAELSLRPSPTSSSKSKRDKADGMKAAKASKWVVYDVPESEGGGSDYCTPTRGPFNCVEGTGSPGPPAPNPMDGDAGSTPKKRKDKKKSKLPGRTNPAAPWLGPVASSFRMQTMHGTASMFLVSENNKVLEYYWNGIYWVWLLHPHTRPMEGVLAVYNGSIFAVDSQGEILVRERHGSGLRWRNCNAPEPIQSSSGSSGKYQLGGLPRVLHPTDQEFFVTRRGTLASLTVAFFQLTWKAYNRPQNVRLRAIADVNLLRKRTAFAVGDDGVLYMCNTVAGVSGHWSGDLSQPPHIRLSPLPGTVLRRSQDSTEGSLFLRTEDGMIVEVAWKSPTWRWIEHGMPRKGLPIVGAPGPAINDMSIFLTASDGSAWELSKNNEGNWQYIDHKKPVLVESRADRDDKTPVLQELNLDSVRPVAMGNDRVFFLTKVGYMAERRWEAHGWIWTLLGTPDNDPGNTPSVAPAVYCTQEPGPFSCILGVKA